MWLAPALGLVLVLSGCTGGPDPGKTFTPTASEKYVPPTRSSSGDASPSAGSGAGEGEYQPATETSPAKNVPVPEYPEAAKANTEDGQKAFIEYWFKTYDYAMDTGDPSLFKAASDPDCEYCTYNIKKLKEMHQEKKAWRIGGGTTVQSESMRAGPPTEETLPWDVGIVSAGVRIYDDSGPAPDYEVGTEETVTMRVWLVRNGDSWLAWDAATVEGSVKNR
ncbi:MAG: DUF6318 family protein [Galactobacter sp.]